MSHKKPAIPDPEPSEEDMKLAVLAWAEFLYDEYMLVKHKQLLLDKQQTKIDSSKGVTGE